VKRGKIDRPELLVFAVDEQLLRIREIGAVVEAQVPHDGLVEGGSRSDLGKCLDRACLFAPPGRHGIRVAIAKPYRSECVEELVAQPWDGETRIDQGMNLGPGSNGPTRVRGEQTNASYPTLCRHRSCFLEPVADQVRAGRYTALISVTHLLYVITTKPSKMEFRTQEWRIADDHINFRPFGLLSRGLIHDCVEFNNSW